MDSWNKIEFEKKQDVKIEKFKERMKICKSCEKLNSLNFCTMCNCFMPIKTRLKRSHCPLKKWLNIL